MPARAERVELVWFEHGTFGRGKLRKIKLNKFTQAKNFVYHSFFTKRKTEISIAELTKEGYRVLVLTSLKSP